MGASSLAITDTFEKFVQRHPLYKRRSNSFHNWRSSNGNVVTTPLGRTPKQSQKLPLSSDTRVTEMVSTCFAPHRGQNVTRLSGDSLRRCKRGYALFFNGRLTKKTGAPNFIPSDRCNLRRSMAKKAMSGLIPCQTQGVRNRAIPARFFRIRPLKGRHYGFGRTGPRKRAAPCGGSINSVRPAHQIDTLVCWVFQTYKEAHHV